MSTIAFVCMGVVGHFLPTLPVVRELASRGEAVVYFIPERYRAQVEAAGGVWQPYGSEVLVSKDRRPRRRKSPSLAEVATLLALDTAASLPALVERLAELRPDVLVCDCYALAGLLAAEHLGIVTVRSNPTYLLSDSLNYYLDAGAGGLSDPAAMRRYNELMGPVFERYNLPFRSFLELRSGRAKLDIVFISRAFYPDAERFDERVALVGPSLLPEARRFGEAVEVEAAPYSALIYVSFGTIFAHDPMFYYLCMEALEPLDARVVMQVGEHLAPQLADELPPNFVVRPPVAQLPLLERADLFITHAGMGGTMEALYYGVPMLAIPRFPEQAITARRTQELGAGLLLLREEVSIAALRRCVMELLGDPAYRKRAKALGEAARADGGYARACERIQELAAPGS